MFSFALLSLSCSLNLASAIVQSPVKGPLKGFNYNPDDDVATLFPLVKNELPNIGAPGFTSARLYTALDPNSADPIPHPAFKAAGDSGTAVLIGLAVSLGDAAFQNELSALTAVLIDQNGTYGNLVSQNLIVGIAVGNEDFYRQSIQGTPAAATQGAGSQPAVIMKQINQVRHTLGQQTPSLLAKIPVGHTDTWQMWTREDYGKQLLTANPSQQNFQPIDFIGMQEFSYWEGYEVHNWTSFRTEALSAVESAASGASSNNNNNGSIPVWVTETGWPTSGPKCCHGAPTDAGMPGLLAQPGKDAAQLYWHGLGCGTLFAGTGSDARNTWWYRIFASTTKSAQADAPLDWRILSSAAGQQGSKGGGVSAAFPLDCGVVAPDVPVATAAVSNGVGRGKLSCGWLALVVMGSVYGVAEPGFGL